MYQFTYLILAEPSSNRNSFTDNYLYAASSILHFHKYLDYTAVCLCDAPDNLKFFTFKFVVYYSLTISIWCYFGTRIFNFQHPDLVARKIHPVFVNLVFGAVLNRPDPSYH